MLAGSYVASHIKSLNPYPFTQAFPAVILRGSVSQTSLCRFTRLAFYDVRANSKRQRVKRDCWWQGFCTHQCAETYLGPYFSLLCAQNAKCRSQWHRKWSYLWTAIGWSRDPVMPLFLRLGEVLEANLCAYIRAPQQKLSRQPCG